jgi:hypothetical protein
MATQNSHNGTLREDLSNSRTTSCYSHCQARKRTPAAKESQPPSSHLMTLLAQSRPGGTFRNSVRTGPHSPLSSPAPWGMAQEANHSHENTWSSSCGNCLDSCVSGEHTRDTCSEGDQQRCLRQRSWCIMKFNYLVDGHQTRTSLHRKPPHQIVLLARRFQYSPEHSPSHPLHIIWGLPPQLGDSRWNGGHSSGLRSP